MDAVEIVRKYLTAYQNLDYPTMASLTSEGFVFQDPAFPNLEGNHARGMFKMFITNSSKTEAKFTVVDIWKGDEQDKVMAKYDADYKFDGRPVANHMTSTFTLQDGKIVKQVDVFDFPAWAAQALGVIGWLFGSFGFLQSSVQKKAAERLERFVTKDSELSK